MGFMDMVRRGESRDAEFEKLQNEMAQALDESMAHDDLPSAAAGGAREGSDLRAAAEDQRAQSEDQSVTAEALAAVEESAALLKAAAVEQATPMDGEATAVEASAAPAGQERQGD